MKILKHVLFLSLFVMFFTNTVHSQEKKHVNEPKIEDVPVNPPSQKEIKVRKVNDPMVDFIPDAAPVIVKKAPVYPGCSGKTYEELKECTRRAIIEYIGSNFNNKVASKTNLKGRQELITTFEIDPTGNVKNILIKHHNPMLKNEVIRVLESLPLIEAGEEDGEKISVSFRIPIIMVL